MTRTLPLLVWTGSGQFDKFAGQKRPEKVLPCISDKAGDFFSAINDNERWGEYNGWNINEICGARVVNIHAPERRAARFRRIRVYRTNLFMPALAPMAAQAFKHNEFRTFHRR